MGITQSLMVSVMAAGGCTYATPPSDIAVAHALFYGFDNDCDVILLASEASSRLSAALPRPAEGSDLRLGFEQDDGEFVFSLFKPTEPTVENESDDTLVITAGGGEPIAHFDKATCNFVGLTYNR